MERSIQQVARLVGTTSRTLRHYDDVGLVPPSRVGSNGYRYYDEQALVRLQRVLLLRGLGLGLGAIAHVLAHEDDTVSALTGHLALLRQEQERLTRQIAAVEHTIDALEGDEEMTPETMFDGFDHTQHREEVERRWGRDAAATSADWWTHLGDDERSDFSRTSAELIRDWIDAARSADADPTSATARHLALRHVAWLRSVPGTPAHAPGADVDGYVRGLAQLYVADERFAATYGGPVSAAFVRDALVAHLAGR